MSNLIDSENSDNKKKFLTDSFLVDTDLDEGSDDVTNRLAGKKKKKKKGKKTKDSVDDLISAQEDILSKSVDYSRSKNPLDSTDNSDSNSDFSTGSDSSVTKQSNQDVLDQRSPFKVFFLHLSLLLQKQFYTFWRNKIPLCFTIFCPIVWVSCLLYLDN
jgi:hypothetical protein